MIFDFLSMLLHISPWNVFPFLLLYIAANARGAEDTGIHKYIKFSDSSPIGKVFVPCVVTIDCTVTITWRSQ